MSKTKPAPLPPESVIGGYRVVRKLSAGGFGLVYLALDTQGQQVAIKEYLPASLATRALGERLPQVAPDKLSLYRLGLKSFFEEGRALAQISHASVVSVMNFFRENETVYMVMNFLEGATLQDFIVTARDLKQQKVFRESTIRSLFDEILHEVTAYAAFALQADGKAICRIGTVVGRQSAQPARRAASPLMERG